MGKIGDVDACITFPRYVEVVLLEVGELPEEVSECPIVVLCGSHIGIGEIVVPMALAEADLHH